MLELFSPLCSSRSRNWLFCQHFWIWFGVWVMVFSTTFNNISVISWWSVLLVEKTEVTKNTTDLWVSPVASHWQTLSHYVVSGKPRHERILTDIYSYKSNYHTITATTSPFWIRIYVLMFIYTQRKKLSTSWYIKA